MSQDKPIQVRRASKIPWEKWEAARIDFVTGKGSCRWVSNRHEISYNSVLQRCYREDWVAQRETWFKEKKLRESTPLIAAALRPPEYHGEVALPQPLSHDFFIHHANRHHANLDPIADTISQNWRRIRGEGDPLTVEQRSGLIRETRELIALQRKMLGIPDVAPIRQGGGKEKRAKAKDITSETGVSILREETPKGNASMEEEEVAVYEGE